MTNVKVQASSRNATYEKQMAFCCMFQKVYKPDYQSLPVKQCANDLSERADVDAISLLMPA